MSPSCKQVSGYSAKEFMDDPSLIQRIVYADDCKLMEQHLIEVEHQNHCEFDFRIVRQDGEVRWLAHRCLAVVGEQGHSMGRRVSNRDITERMLIKKALQESEEKLRNLYELSPLGIALADMKGRFVEFNEAFRRICGYSKEELKSLDYRVLTPKKYGTDIVRQFESLANTGRYGPFEKEYLRKDGTLIPIRLNGLSMTGHDGQKYIWSIVEDITERKRAEETQIESNRKTQFLYDLMGESEQRFRGAFETAAHGMALVSTEGRFIKVNLALCAMLGYSEAELLATDFQTITHPDDLATDLGYVHDLLEKRIETYQMEKRYFHKSGKIIWILLSVSLVRSKEGIPIHFVSHIQDITERKQSEVALAEAHKHLEMRVIERTEQLRLLAVQVTLAEEKERHAIARDLHDDLGQVLHVARIKLDELSSNLSGDRHSEVVELNNLISDSSRLVRSLTSQLSPPTLSDLGLGSALLWLCDELERNYSLDIDARIEEIPISLSHVESVILFRAARELLINVGKHSKSSAAIIELFCRNNCLMLIVEDNGIGIDNIDLSFAVNKGFGLSSVSERIVYLGGSLELNSKLEGGLRAILKLPFMNTGFKGEEFIT